MPTSLFSQLRLFQLISPSLPTGAFTYSQGLEWAVECGWVRDRESLTDWLESILQTAFVELEIPLLKRLYQAAGAEDFMEFSRWTTYAVSCRETGELRLEEINRGRAMAKILGELGVVDDARWLEEIRRSQSAGFALAACRWDIDLGQAALGYTWGWLENMVMAAVKIIPLGQTTGQQVLAHIAGRTPMIIQEGLHTGDEEMAGSCPVLTMSSCLHETQYTRLFRS